MTALNHYSRFLDKWNKLAGPKPSATALESVHKTGARPGSKATFAMAMYLRPQGATGAQIVAAVGTPQLNKMRQFVSTGQAKKVAMSANDQGHTVYKITLTGKSAPPKKADGKTKKAATKGSKKGAKQETPAKEQAPAEKQEAPAQQSA